MIDYWNTLSPLFQMLVRGLAFSTLTWIGIATLGSHRKVSGMTRRLVWQVSIAGLLVISALAFLPPLWSFNVPAEQVEAVEPTNSVIVSETDEVTTEMAGALREDSLPSKTAPPKVSLPTIILMVWILGAISLILRWLFGWLKVQQILRKREEAPWQVQEAFEEAIQQLGLNDEPRLVTSSLCPTPFVVGAFRPTVVLPSDCGSWDLEATRSIFLHELAHLRGKDPLFLLLGNIVKVLHWPNPLVWAGTFAWKESAELAADEAVVRSGVLPSHYAETLCQFANRPTARQISVGLTMADTSTEMEQRVGRLLLLDNTKPKKTMMTKITTSVLAAGTLLIGGLAVSKEIPNSKEQPVDPRVAEMEQRVENLKIPMIDFQDITLEEAVAFLRIRCEELEASDQAKENPINFHIKQSDHFDPDERIIKTLYLKKVSLSFALKTICREVGVEYEVNRHGVTILMPEGQLPPKKTLENPEVLAKLPRIVLSDINFSDATLEEAVSFLQNHPQLQEHGLKIGLIAEEGIASKVLPKTQVPEISLLTLLQKICEASETRLEFEGNTILITPEKQK